MRRRDPKAERDLLAGTLDMLILRMLQAGPAHGLQIAQDIERRSGDVLLVEQGSLYPALYRLEERGWVTSEWSVSDTGRRARFYSLTRLGRQQLTVESGRWDTLVRAVAKAMRPRPSER
jgi:transcriptional regulator